MNIRIHSAFGYPKEIALLFSEYTDLLRRGDPGFQKYLDLQGYEEEVKHLEIKYGPPFGRLYLAWQEEAPAGCIGLRKMDGERCEMKRLYVRPAYRGSHIGGRLVEKVLADGKDMGYRYMYLDTLPFLQNAIDLYKKYGFYEIPKYNDSPMDTGIYMRREL